MKINFTSGQLIKMGKFAEAIPVFYNELDAALHAKVTNHGEVLMVSKEFSKILLNPSKFDEVQALGDKMMRLIMRIPGYLEPVSKEEFYKNVKLNYDTIKSDDPEFPIF